jgi:4'-phosphopantetheinyl transferase
MTFPTLDSLGCEVLVLYAYSGAAVFAEQQTVLAQTLGADERARSERFHFEDDRRTYVVAHALLRRALSAQSGLPAAAFSFVAGEHGRPEIEAPLAARSLRFNLSHTRGLVACALTLHADIGVDVETADRRTDLQAVGRRVFSARELLQLQALPEPDQRTRFFDLWTLKEAYIKAIGKGLSAPLRSISFDAAALDPVPVHFDPDVADDAQSWCIRRHLPGPAHRMAVAWRGQRAQLIRFVEVGAAELLTA